MYSMPIPWSYASQFVKVNIYRGRRSMLDSIVSLKMPEDIV